MRFLTRARALPPLLITMGGLSLFERTYGVSAPEQLERILYLAVDDPASDLPAIDMAAFTGLIAACLQVSGNSAPVRSARRMLVSAPEVVGRAIAGFFQDPIPADEDPSERSSSEPRPSILDLRSSWISEGRDPVVFDSLTLWEHTRIMRAAADRRRTALADASIAARAAQGKPKDFKAFMDTLAPEVENRQRLGDVIRAATAGLPTISKADLAKMQGRPS